MPQENRTSRSSATSAVAVGDASDLDNSGAPLPFYLSFNGVGKFVMPIPPQHVNIDHGSFANLSRSKRGNWVDEWGPKPIVIDISGTFGWGKNSANSGQGTQTGKESLEFFVQLKMARDARIERGREDPNDLLVTYLDAQRGVVLDCVIQNCTYNADKTNPHLYFYTMRLQAVRTQKLFSRTGLGPIVTSTGAQPSLVPQSAQTTNVQNASATAQQPFGANATAGNGVPVSPYIVDTTAPPAATPPVEAPPVATPKGTVHSTVQPATPPATTPPVGAMTTDAISQQIVGDSSLVPVLKQANNLDDSGVVSGTINYYDPASVAAFAISYQTGYYNRGT